MRDEVPVAGIREWLEMLLGRRVGLRVEGNSMEPTLKSGDRVLVDPKAPIRPGDIVLTDHPFKSSIRLIKRLVSIEADGRIFLAGDNAAESSDSRIFGVISRKHLVGKVVSRMR
ncbi:MAG TPA: nickel-type superoxide dismutase maturation protease [Pyrinomonadaceae bacterium]|nr:nickel-type superoxide dismutase maturation protease [Pyrinomonadaceae bacterium]